MRDTKSASRRHDDETDRLREEMKALKGIIPKSMNANKEFTDNRLKEITNEVKSLKALISQRMNSSSSPSAAAASSINVSSPPPPVPSINTTNGFLRPTTGNSPIPPTASGASSPGIDAMAKEIGDAKQAVRDRDENSSPASGTSASRQDYLSAIGGRNSPFGSGSGKAAIPAWQLAASGQAEGQAEASGSSS